MRLEFELSDKIADAEIDDAFSEQQPAQGVDAIDDLGDILLLIQVDKLKSKEIWKLDLCKKAEEDRNVIRVSKLEPRMTKYANSTFWI